MPSCPDDAASYTISIRQIGDLLTASFRPYFAVAALAVQLEIPVIKVLRGLSPPSHFLVRFRLRVPNTPVTALRAMPGAQNERPLDQAALFA